jgi:hypothetical protein
MIQINEHLLALLFGLALIGACALGYMLLDIVFLLAWRRLPDASEAEREKYVPPERPPKYLPKDP